jgi:hypothetical protein
MSDIETRKLFEGQHCKAEALMDGMPLARPVYFRGYLGGSYLSCERAEALAAELTAAAAAARKAGSP